MVALAQEALAGPSMMGLFIKGMHQPLAHHDYQLTLREELFWWLAIVKTIHKPSDSFLKSPKIKTAVLRLGRWRLFSCAAGKVRWMTDVSLKGKNRGSK